MDSRKSIPVAAFVLGAGGLIPFATCAALLVLKVDLPFGGGEAQVRALLVVYASAILSFLGGARWGIAMGYADVRKQTRDFAVAILKSHRCGKNAGDREHL